VTEKRTEQTNHSLSYLFAVRIGANGQSTDEQSCDFSLRLRCSVPPCTSVVFSWRRGHRHPRRELTLSRMRNVRGWPQALPCSPFPPYAFTACAFSQSFRNFSRPMFVSG